MGIARLYWKIYHRIFILYQFIFRIIYKYFFSKEIKRLIKDKKKTLYIIYDMSISPVAYGEIFDCLMFARSLQAAGNKIIFIFTNDQIRDDYKKILNKNTLLKERLNDIYKLSQKLINKENIIFRKKKLAYYIDGKEKINKQILFFNAVRKKIPLYKFAHNLCFYVYQNLNNNSKRKFLLNKNEFKIKSSYKNKFKNYICIGVRMSLNNERERNIDVNELNDMIKKIKKNNYENKIVIVSDLESYKILKNNKNFFLNKNIILSKKYHTNFIDDGALILNSKKYYQLKGSGIQMYAEFSNINYEIFHNYKDYTIFANILRSDLYFNYKQKIKNIWQTKNQKFLDLSKFKLR